MKLAPLAELELDELDELDELLRIYIRGTFVVCQQAVRRLRGGGSLITFSSSVVGLAFRRTPPTPPARARSRQ